MEEMIHQILIKEMSRISFGDNGKTFVAPTKKHYRRDNNIE